MADPIQSFLALHETETYDIPQQRRSVCCCGNESCAYLKHNQGALDGLERDVSNAARLGQALLMRHEAYITDSEGERKAMAARIDTLEGDKEMLERKNASVIEENRSLLDQLEALNNSVFESDAQVTNLQATLQSTQLELQRLSQLASRTERLEQQLAEFEREQATWQTSLEAKDDSERSAVRRWQKAERTLASLQDQMERIEREAKEERDRHAEIMGRMERRHAVERELGSAAGRLKGAAALKSSDRGGPETSVVSHFVKDILQDNANLQMGIVELREMLTNSNEEVENLRGQLTLHRPTDEDDETTPQAHSTRKDLSIELNRANSQELHVHHHYHAPSTATKAQPLRRPKKKRYAAIASGHSSGTSTPRSSFSNGTPASAATILRQTAASVPQTIATRNRWSMQSNHTYQSMAPSSGPSSPQSATNRTSSIFDRVFSDAGNESSRPTTPDTEAPGSPILPLGHSKRGSGSWSRTYSAPVVQRQSRSAHVLRPSLDAIISIEELPKLNKELHDEQAIPEEDDEQPEEVEWENESSPAADADSSVTSPMSDDLQNPLHHDDSFYYQPLRRAASHESLLSVSGMDIHTLKTRPSQLLAPYARGAITSQAVISDTTAHATRPAVMSRTSANSRSLLSGMASEQRQPQKPGFGKKVGGWMFGNWGATPALTEETAPEPMKRPKPASVSSGGSDKPFDPQETSKKPQFRSAGINQNGPLIGFFPEMKARPAAPVMKSLDEEGLRDVLGAQ